MKAYFIDYTGTMVQEDEPYTRELPGYFLSHSDLNTPQEALKVVYSIVSDAEAAAAVGIQPVYLSRKEAKRLEGVRVIRSLSELQAGVFRG